MTSDDSQLSFGRWLRRRRKALELTQVELAARVPCAQGTLRRIEADDLLGMAECLNGLAAALIALQRPEPAALLLGDTEALP